MNHLYHLEAALDHIEPHHKNIRTLNALTEIINNLDRIPIEKLENLIKFTGDFEKNDIKSITLSSKLTKEDILKAFKAGEKNIDFTALHGGGTLSTAEKYYKNTYENKKL